MLFAYPKSAQFGRVIPKSKIYEHAGANTALKELFVAQVDQIVWKYKLAPETTNLHVAKSITEIQVFAISLKLAPLHSDVLRAIDRAIPFPLIFEVAHGSRRQTIAAFKRPSEVDGSKWVVSDYFKSEWTPSDSPRTSLPVALDLASLYDKVLTALMPVQPLAEENIQARVDRMEAIKSKELEVGRIKGQLSREKQYNKRVSINAALRVAKQELVQLKAADLQND
ncbi:hypothetical protein NIG5292_02353 [Nereida ignava]|uniref:Methyl-accepting chemotaxis protein n=1 Tax=Nereida ignava TaxID=282199 RepID=A0A0U1NNJ9_9RHOB|nr:DUF4391 domain-containing protein [Nereida ignava]CRK76296.1 hypothetical protein NIG5292_02353 [Nereida ignava]SFJ81553.1 protein of unknown function [Nereida ignava DSM 16309]